MIDLDLASNMMGRPLSEDSRARLLAVLDHPDEDTWDAAHGIILNGSVGLGLTLWQAVCEFDPLMATVGPSWRWVEDDSELGGHPERVRGWGRIPTRAEIERAIGYAVR